MVQNYPIWKRPGCERREVSGEMDLLKSVSDIGERNRIISRNWILLQDVSARFKCKICGAHEKRRGPTSQGSH